MEFRNDLIEDIVSQAIGWRHELHRHPQTAYEETFAADLIASRLDSWGIPYLRGIGQTGLVATIQGRTNQSGKTIGFRADMDALNIEENSGQPWSSIYPGKMHGCGHDGHAATLLALAKYLHQTRHFDGTVQLIFQPSEETGGGAESMIADGLLDKAPFDEIYGFHNWPGLPRGTFAIRSGAMLAAVDEFQIALKGKGGHAGFPHLAKDPIPAASQLVLALQTLVSREISAQSAAVISVTNLIAGSGSFNVLPETATLNGTVRTLDAKVRDQIQARMFHLCAGLEIATDIQIQIKYTRLTDVVHNHPQCTETSRLAAKAVVGSERIEDFEPIMGGEDFGGFLKLRPGAFIVVGQREPSEPSSPHNYGLHSPRYDFNDAIIPLVVRYFTEITEARLPSLCL